MVTRFVGATPSRTYGVVHYVGHYQLVKFGACYEATTGSKLELTSLTAKTAWELGMLNE